MRRHRRSRADGRAGRSDGRDALGVTARPRSRSHTRPSEDRDRDRVALGAGTGEDAVECLLAGAWAVQVGTATLTDPAAAVTVAQGIVRRLKTAGLASPAGLRGLLQPPEPVATEEDPVPAP
ncbi:MAG: hypothetical protein E6G63_01855 [Actinobacteria bacterium]|nr:MAG: hypothetical protein E6G63_01855 [Actinomycetota bacterium]